MVKTEASGEKLHFKFSRDEFLVKYDFCYLYKISTNTIKQY